MMQTVQRLVQQQAVMIRRTFIEVVDFGLTPHHRKPQRHRSDSAILSKQVQSFLSDLSFDGDDAEGSPQAMNLEAEVPDCYNHRTPRRDTTLPLPSRRSSCHQASPVGQPSRLAHHCPIGSPVPVSPVVAFFDRTPNFHEDASPVSHPPPVWTQWTQPSMCRAQVVAGSASAPQTLPHEREGESTSVQEQQHQSAPVVALVMPVMIPASGTSMAPLVGTSSGASSGNRAASDDDEAPPLTTTTKTTTPGKTFPIQRVPTPQRQERTTVMLRNIPNNYTREKFLSLLDQVGLAGFYDFAYLPVDFRTGAALGYAYVNAVDHPAARKVWRALDGFVRWGMPSRKCCSVSWSDPHQGLAANIERYRNSPLMHATVPDEYKPAIFEKGVRIVYPSPTKTVRPPRSRK